MEGISASNAVVQAQGPDLSPQEAEARLSLLGRGFSLSELLKPYLAKMAARKFSPQKILQSLRRSYTDWARLIDSFPGEVAGGLDSRG